MTLTMGKKAKTARWLRDTMCVAKEGHEFARNNCMFSSETSTHNDVDNRQEDVAHAVPLVVRGKARVRYHHSEPLHVGKPSRRGDGGVQDQPKQGASGDCARGLHVVRVKGVEKNSMSLMPSSMV